MAGLNEIPSLNALRAFEAAARKGSIKEGAAELYVTPGAVSQQIKGLEAALGTVLFIRDKRGLQLTAAGASLYPVLREAFADIGAALERLKEQEQTGPLTVSMVPSFASKWLVPRLGRFRERHPEIDVRISASHHAVDFAKEGVDMAVRLGLGDFPGLREDWLLTEPLYAVCSPALLKGPLPLGTPEDLGRHTLLHDETHREWKMWLEMHGVNGVDHTRGPVFNDASMALNAAIEGQGVAMGRGELVALDMAAGRLVRPFDLTMPFHFAYYVVCPEAVAEWPKVAAFREWVLEEAAGEQARAGGRPPAGPA